MMRPLPLFLVCAIGLAASVEAGTIEDGDFLDWKYSSTVSGLYSPSATAAFESSGGNPGARVNITTHTTFSFDEPISTAFGNAIKSDVYTSDALEGLGFSVALDFIAGPGSFGQGQALYLLVEQGGRIFGQFAGLTGFNVSWTTGTAATTFAASNFVEFNSNGIDGSSHPVFDGSTPTFFGFSAGNSASGDLTQYYDNFYLDIPDANFSPVPEPSSIALASLGGIGVAIAAYRKRQIAV